MKQKKIVRVLAPGFRPSDNVLSSIGDFIKTNKEFDFLFDPHVIDLKHPLNSASEEVRFQSLKSALFETDSEVLWCLRGGYGSIQLLKQLDTIKKTPPKKLLIGLSDITSLHIYFQQRWGWQTLHGSHLDRWIENKLSAKNLKENLEVIHSRSSEVIFKKLKPVNEIAKSSKKISAKITGGNLITLNSHTGTPYEIQTKGKFLFFEEIGERAYKIDRCLEQLLLAGKFEQCAGLLIGQMTQCVEPDGKSKLKWLWKSWGEKLKIPIFTGVETGHEAYQRPLPLNTLAELKKVGDQFALSVENVD